MFSVAFVCLFVSLLAILLKKNYQQIVMKFYGGFWGGKRKKWLDFGSDPGHNSKLAEVCTPRVPGI